MSIEKRNREDVVILAVHGRMDTEQVRNDLRVEAHSAIDEGCRLVIDLTHAQWPNIEGIGVLMEIASDAKRARTLLRLVIPDDRLRLHVKKATQNLFVVTRRLEDALISLGLTRDA